MPEPLIIKNTDEKERECKTHQRRLQVPDEKRSAKEEHREAHGVTERRAKSEKFNLVSY
ncbi:MAG: hypothetical protein Q8P88_00025 [Candidatus Jorgensenbacteria bacterium]|nr:hypothetical protein [Candidatus Jorgensenbacteria bacterium]